jgi:deoxyribodipyrimidine photo-lyase
VNSRKIQKDRIQLLNRLDICNGNYVLYWMQQSQRAEFNHALEYALEQGNRIGQSVLVAFGLMNDYPQANLRHYTFMLEGLKETQASLAARGIKMVVQIGEPADVALALGRRASLIVCDCGYLRHQKEWRAQVARKAACRAVQVETDVVVPVEVVSGKAEYAARTIRPKILKHLDSYLIEFKTTPVKHTSLDLRIYGLDLKNLSNIVDKLKIDRSLGPATRFFTGGTSRAKKRFKDFIRRHLTGYVENSNQPQTDDISHMSMYLHFGQISPLYLALRIQRADPKLAEARDAFLEQLIIRRELAANFVNYTPNYDAYDCIPGWARQTLSNHQKDKRGIEYSRRQLEAADTHDAYWNAAMREMKYTGFMHNYMRMYWGKKILQWSSTPPEAFQTTLAINDKYFIDGRDPNSYAGVAWIYGVHDRAWPERPIFGKIRYMAASGLERKCDMGAYLKKVDMLISRVPESDEHGSP